MEDVLAVVAGELPAGGRPVLVAIGWGDGAGKTTFADRLADVVARPVVRATVDDFHLPRAIRHAGGRAAGTVRSSAPGRVLARSQADDRNPRGLVSP